jgi:hypothetical protein
MRIRKIIDKTGGHKRLTDQVRFIGIDSGKIRKLKIGIGQK